jgi:nucleoside-diphosphate-sugar epimerase
MGTKLVITGITGYLGKVLLPRLLEDSQIDHIVGVDAAPFAEAPSSEKFTFHQLDVRDPQFEALLEGVDVVLHMAFKLMRLPGAQDTDQVNIDGSKHIFELTANAGVPKLIFTSSVVAYGLHPDNPIPLSEKMPLRPNEGLYYSRAKAELEGYLEHLATIHPDMTITRLRPCTVVGPTAERAMVDSLISDTLIMVKGCNPPYQLVHEEDVASAIRLAIKEDLHGAFNVTGSDPVPLKTMVEERGGKSIALPMVVLRPMIWLLWRTGQSVFAPEWLDLSRFPLVANNTKLQAAGWSPQYTTRQAYLSLVEAFKAA